MVENMQSSEKINLSVTVQSKLSEVRRITEFEGLRAILAWWVVWSHLLPYSGFPASHLPLGVAWLGRAGYAVDVFIILSGFVIFLLLDNSEKSYLQFMNERFFRIYPLFLILFMLAIVLMPLKITVFADGTWHELEFATKMLDEAQSAYQYLYLHIFSHLTLLHGAIPDQILPDSSIAFLAPAWSLSLEWQFYLIAPLLIFWLKRSPGICFLIIFVVSMIGKLSAKLGLSFGYGAFLPLKMNFFVIGIFSYYVYKFSQLYPRKTLSIFPYLSTGLTAGTILMSFLPYQSIVDTAIPTAIWLIGLSAAIATSIKADFLPFSLMAKFLNGSLLQHLGKVSYSTYLTHLLVFWLLMWGTAMIFPDVDKGTMLIILSSVGELSVVAASFAFFYWVEKPFIRIGKQVSKSLASS